MPGGSWRPGSTVDAFAYDGQVPGPDLRVTEGDTVRISVQNNLAEPTTVHWHGVHVPANMDGVPGLSQEPIAPGGVFTYEFVATPAGTRWYHAHVDNVVFPSRATRRIWRSPPLETCGPPVGIR